MPVTPDALLKKLEMWKISFKLLDHAPLNTVEDSKNYFNSMERSNVSIAHIKNLYLRDHKKNNFLLVLQQDKEIDLKQMSTILKSGRLSFGSKDRLFENLGVYPGAVTPFSMINGVKKSVNIFLDVELKLYSKLYAHPLVNNKTIEIGINDLDIFFKKIGVKANWIDF